MTHQNIRRTAKVGAALTLLAALLVLSCLLALPVSAATSCVTDATGTLTGAQVTELCALAQTEGARGGIGLYAVVTEDAYYDQYDFMRDAGLSEEDDFVLLIVFHDTAERAWYYDIYTFGSADRALSNREIDLILDDPGVYNNLKTGRIYDGLSAFMPLVADYMLTDAKAPLGPHIAFSVIGAVVIAGIAVLVVVLKYRMKVKPTNYPLDQYATLKPGRAQDIFLGSSVTSHTVSSSSGGSGGSSGRGSGGGHRGGR